MQIGAVKAVADRQGVLRAAEGKAASGRCGSRARAAVSRSETGFRLRRPRDQDVRAAELHADGVCAAVRRDLSRPAAGDERDRVFQHVIPP